MAFPSLPASQPLQARATVPGGVFSSASARLAESDESHPTNVFSERPSFQSASIYATNPGSRLDRPLNPKAMSQINPSTVTALKAYFQRTLDSISEEHASPSTAPPVAGPDFDTLLKNELAKGTGVTTKGSAAQNQGRRVNPGQFATSCGAMAPPQMPQENAADASRFQTNMTERSIVLPQDDPLAAFAIFEDTTQSRINEFEERAREALANVSNVDEYRERQRKYHAGKYTSFGGFMRGPEMSATGNAQNLDDSLSFLGGAGQVKIA